MADSDRPTGGYAGKITEGAAWPDVSAASLSSGLAWGTSDSKWALSSLESVAAYRRDVRDCFIEGFDAIHAAADKLVRGHDLSEVAATSVKAWWLAAQNATESAKINVRSVVELALEDIAAIERAPNMKDSQKSSAIDQVVSAAHNECVQLVAAAASGIPPYPHFEFPRVFTRGGGTQTGGSSIGSGNSPGLVHAASNDKKRLGDDHGKEQDGKKAEERGKSKDHSRLDDDAKEKQTDKTKSRLDNDGAEEKSAAPREVKRLDTGPQSETPILAHPMNPSGMPASPLSGAGAGGGSPASGMGSLGSSLGRGPSASGLGSGTGAGTGTGGPASPPVASQASLLRAFGGPAGLDSAAAGPVARPASVAPPAAGAPAAVPITAAQGTPVAPVQPAAVPAPAPPAPPAQTAAPLTGGGLPLMGPAPATANPLSSAPAAAPVSATAGPAVPLAGGGGASTSATVVPMTPGERARQLVARSTRQMLGDLAGEVRRLAAALTASTKNLPTLQWVVGGCPDDGSGQLMVVASSAGLGFIPASTRLPRHTAVHVFGESPNVPWGIKRGWMGNPLKAVQGYGVSINRPVTVVAGRPEALAGAAGVGVEFVTAENIPDGGVQGGRDRLEVVDPAQFDQISGLGTAALAALLPTAGGFEVEPNNERTMALWTAVDMAATVGESHLIKAWQDFCTDQATASAYKVTRADSDLTARQYYSDYAYFVWNLAQLEKAMEAAA
ncbi:hypothetical protein [Mycobacteroides abscessus]|uniref:hypothetical protein n=1 Tax=Mycobacteroides abscessus TaxID=36809 RepID=UPI0012FECFBC|nr:hypothetical protein [Mycobacteroides abscessus]